MIFLLLLLILIPIFAYKWAKNRNFKYIYTFVGAMFGFVVTPFSLGLYATFYIPFMGLPTGVLGLIMVMIHMSLGWKFSLFLT